MNVSIRQALVSAFLAVVIVACLNISATIYLQRQSDQRWCSLLLTLDTPDEPPKTDRGRIVQDRVSEMADKLRCGRK